MNPHITPNTLGIGRITLQNALLVAHISILLIMEPAYYKKGPIVNPYLWNPYTYAQITCFHSMRCAMVIGYTKAHPIVNPCEATVCNPYTYRPSSKSLDRPSQLLHSPGSLNTLTLPSYIHPPLRTHKYEYNLTL